MTVKKRVFITNTLMVFISLLLLLGLGSGMIQLFERDFLTALSTDNELADHITEVEALLNQEENVKGDWGALAKKTSAYGYHLYVMNSRGEVIYSDVNESERECVEAFDISQWKPMEQAKISYLEKVTVVRRNVMVGQVPCFVYAACGSGDYEIFGLGRGMIEMFAIAFLCVGIVAILAILLLSQFMTNRLIQKIMHPVNLLTEAAKRVEQGNLKEKIGYEKQDEFLEVCNTFDTMQLHLRQQMETMAHYEKARTDMVSGISHDLRTPLTAMKGSVRGILDGVAQTPEKQKQYLEIAYSKCCEMDSLLERLFYFSKMETGNMPMIKQTIDIGQWLKGYVNSRSKEWKEHRGLNLIFTVSILESPLYVSLDVEQMKRVLDNLLENSIKYAKAEPLRMTFSLHREKDGVVLRVHDNGGGVEEEKIGRIFEQFYRGDESRTCAKDGNGLGLYICQYIVKAHGGSITAENRDGLLIEIVLPEKGKRKAENE